MPVLAITRERREGETRVAATPDSVKRLAALGFGVVVEAGAGLGAAVTDKDYAAAGARIAAGPVAALKDADVLFKVSGLAREEIEALKPGVIVTGLFNPHQEKAQTDALTARGATVFAMELIPRITRAQAMDALSSQANLAGYRAVVEAAEAYGRLLPMMMTAAGTIAAARVFVMGAGVAGLQAIATARRLGAVVTATDVRPAAKEQVQSLGARFVAVEDEEFKAAETAAGYAKEMSAGYLAKQAALVAEHIRKQDIVITTALVPGRPAPRLVSAEQVASMRPGSVLVDLAVAQGGNVEGVARDQIIEVGGVKIVGFSNLAARVAADASALYARNLTAFAALLVKDGELVGEFDDEILKASLVARSGAVVHPALQAA